MPLSHIGDQSWSRSLLLLLFALMAGSLIHTLAFGILRRKNRNASPDAPDASLEPIRWPTFFLSMEIVLLILHPAIPFPGCSKPSCPGPSSS